MNIAHILESIKSELTVGLSAIRNLNQGVEVGNKLRSDVIALQIALLQIKQITEELEEKVKPSIRKAIIDHNWKVHQNKDASVNEGY